MQRQGHSIIHRLLFPSRILGPVLAMAAVPMRAEVRPHALFSEGAVLQRGRPLEVWGTARSGETVSVELAGRKAVTTAADGRWSVRLEPIEAAGPLTMTITGDNEVAVKDLFIGDVWLCSGQSNMHFQMKSVENAAQEIAAMDFPLVRFFTVKQQFALEPLCDASGTWKSVTPATAADGSAVACYFGTALHRKQGVPIGLIVSSVGGTRIESWMSPRTLADTGESSALVEKWGKISPEEFRKIGAAYSAFQHQRDHVHPESVRAAKAKGLPAPPVPDAPKLRCHDRPGALHNGMIAPLQPFAIRGAIWYQGESNSEQPGPYQKLLPAMIGDWRRVWGNDLPFLFVQLAPHRSIHPAFREAQQLIWENTARTAMVVTTDAGDPGNIHPARKRPVGERLTLAARAISYGEAIVYSGPRYESMMVERGKAFLRFSHTGGGLVAKGGELRGFTIAGADHAFVPATVEIRGDTVLVTADGVTEPKAVRYNWAMQPDGNLFNREDLPAAPFRTDRPAASSR